MSEMPVFFHKGNVSDLGERECVASNPSAAWIYKDDFNDMILLQRDNTKGLKIELPGP
jgi:hypothetical protein